MLSFIRSYWKYLQRYEIVPRDRIPFANLHVKDPPHRRKTRDDEVQKWEPEQMVVLWNKALSNDDKELFEAIKIAAYSGARVEGVAQLKTTDIRVDPTTKIRFMRMRDKTQAGDRDVPIHSKISNLIDQVMTNADSEGYLIHSAANNKYAERSPPISKRFGRLKTKLGFDQRYRFHSIRHTVTSQFENAECPENIAHDIVGHVKAGLTYGIYSGITRMDKRAEWLEKAIFYPTG
jgi:site-specific recombinase XerD